MIIEDNGTRGLAWAKKSCEQPNAQLCAASSWGSGFTAKRGRTPKAQGTVLDHICGRLNPFLVTVMTALDPGHDPVPISLQWEWAALAENGKSEIRRMNSALRISTGPSVYRRHRHRHLRLFPIAHSAVARELRTPTHPLAHSLQAGDSFARAMPSRGASGGSDSNLPRICSRYRS